MTSTATADEHAWRSNVTTLSTHKRPVGRPRKPRDSISKTRDKILTLPPMDCVTGRSWQACEVLWLLRCVGTKLSQHPNYLEACQCNIEEAWHSVKEDPPPYQHSRGAPDYKKILHTLGNRYTRDALKHKLNQMESKAKRQDMPKLKRSRGKKATEMAHVSV